MVSPTCFRLALQRTESCLYPLSLARHLSSAFAQRQQLVGYAYGAEVRARAHYLKDNTPDMQMEFRIHEAWF